MFLGRACDWAMHACWLPLRPASAMHLHACLSMRRDVQAGWVPAHLVGSGLNQIFAELIDLVYPKLLISIMRWPFSCWHC
jgi:hypothetical protein